MRLHLAARIHAAVFDLFRPRDETETRALHQRVRDLYVSRGLNTAPARKALTSEITGNVASALNVSEGNAHYPPLADLIERLLDYEGLFAPPLIDWREKRGTSAWWELREALYVHLGWLDDLDDTIELVQDGLAALLAPILDAAPRNPPNKTSARDLTVPIRLLDSLNASSGLGSIVELLDDMITTACAEDLAARGLFTRLRGQVERNLLAASGDGPFDPPHTNRRLVPPSKSGIKDRAELVESYLGTTPLYDFLTSKAELVIPERTRFEHTHIIAGSGHGKTQALQNLIYRDFEAVAAGKRSIVVLDSRRLLAPILMTAPAMDRRPTATMFVALWSLY